MPPPNLCFHRTLARLSSLSNTPMTNRKKTDSPEKLFRCVTAAKLIKFSFVISLKPLFALVPSHWILSHRLYRKKEKSCLHCLGIWGGSKNTMLAGSYLMMKSWEYWMWSCLPNMSWKNLKNNSIWNRCWWGCSSVSNSTKRFEQRVQCNFVLLILKS